MIPTCLQLFAFFGFHNAIHAASGSVVVGVKETAYGEAGKQRCRQRERQKTKTKRKRHK